MKRKVITYHSTISNNKLERALNKDEGYRLEDTIQHGGYETLILVEDGKQELLNETPQKKIVSVVNISLEKEHAQETIREYQKLGYEINKVTTKNCLLVEYEKEDEKQ